MIVGFTGNGGSPLHGFVDPVFLSPQSEYRPTEYMQGWARQWFDDALRLEMAKAFFDIRLSWVAGAWDRNPDLQKAGLSARSVPSSLFREKSLGADSTAGLLSIEGEWAKTLYRLLAQKYSMSDFRREEGKQTRESVTDLANSFLDHGNYIAYGYAAAALNILGISFAFPVMHGKTRRGALVFDVADLFKDAIVLPLAFHAAASGFRDQEYRDAVIEVCQKEEVLDQAIETIISVATRKTTENQSTTT